MPPGIDKDQLQLLMESYKEQVQLNTKLLERQAQFLDNLDQSTQKLIEAINSQTEAVHSTLEVGFATMGQKITEEHGGLSLRLYVAMGGMLSIIATLIAMWITK